MKKGMGFGGVMLMRMFIIAVSILVLVAGQAVAEEKNDAEKALAGSAMAEKQKMSDQEKGQAAAKEKAGAEKTPAEPATAEKQKMNDKERLSYSYGYEMGRTLKSQSGNLAPDLAAKGVVDAMNATLAKQGMSEQEKRSYSSGYEIGNSLKKVSGDLAPDMASRGVMDAISGKQPAMSDQERRETIVAFRTKNNKELAGKNKKEGEEFLTANKKKEGVVVLPSGLQYKVIKEGTGLAPKGTEKVRVHYRGAFIDGTEFANTYKEGDEGPWIVYVNDVIPGWSEALKIMKVGSKWQLFIPSSLAFGEQGNPPNAVLIYNLELLSIH